MDYYAKEKEEKGMIIGITGSSGSGKSTVCKILEKEYKVKIINADKIAKKLSKKGTSYIQDIIDAFGKDIVDEEGELKRKKLAEIIYSDAEKREKLNSCTFKYIVEEIKKQINKVQEDTTVIIDAPLLFEAKLDKICDTVIGVISKRELQLDRMVARDNIDYEQAEKRLASQKNNAFYQEKCDIIIKNGTNMKILEDRIKEISEKLKMQSKREV